MNEITLKNETTASETDLRPLIHEIRDMQVMLDRDLAKIYGVETKVLNQSVKRNIKRFPERFRFQLSKEEMGELVTNCDRFKSMKHASSSMYAFTEQGIAMLSTVLRSETAVSVSIRIMDAFVAMRKMMVAIAPVLGRIEAVERRQLKQEDAQSRNEARFEKIFDAMQDKTFPPQKLFFDGQFYDAFLWIKGLIKKAKSELIVIDPYFDASALPLFAEKRKAVRLLVVRGSRGKKQLPDVDVQKFNAQYEGTLEVKDSDRFHDRFIIIDRKQLIHIGASLNYLGKKCFACSTFDSATIPELIAKLS